MFHELSKQVILENIPYTLLQKHPIFKVSHALQKITKLEKTLSLQSNRAYEYKYYWLKGALIQNKFKG
ncbi:hypothetical protein [Bartonella sp. AA56HLJMS]|uniref:hypothetical protein n=1 Tax=Bartonella sp. AA56HLJMS TaxID=3243434 RepID=UPI0035CFFA1C